MRDSDIFRLKREEQNKLASLFRQIQFLNLRLLAYEEILSRPISMLRAIIQPQWLRQQVDAVQMRSIKDHDAEVAKRIEEIQAKEKQPKIQIVGANGIVQ